jgi:hypothetical protein
MTETPKLNKLEKARIIVRALYNVPNEKQLDAFLEKQARIRSRWSASFVDENYRLAVRALAIRDAE